MPGDNLDVDVDILKYGATYFITGNAGYRGGEGVGAWRGRRGPSMLRRINFVGLLTEMTWCRLADGDVDARIWERATLYNVAPSTSKSPPPPSVPRDFLNG